MSAADKSIDRSVIRIYIYCSKGIINIDRALGGMTQA